MTAANIRGMVFDIRRFSVHDGPGIRTTVFLKGCPLRCRWCHNPESFEPNPTLFFYRQRCLGCGVCVQSCPRQAIIAPGIISAKRCRRCGHCAAICPAKALVLIGKRLTIAAVMREVVKDRPFYDRSGGGLTVSGGEPLMQPEFTAALLQAARARRIHTALDTSGYAAADSWQRVLAWTDTLLFDLKCGDPVKHRALTGVSNRRILENLKLSLRVPQLEIVIRIPVIPGLNDSPGEMLKIRRILNRLGGVFTVDLLPYNVLAAAKYRLGNFPAYALNRLRPPPAETLARLRRCFSDYPVFIGGNR